MKSCRFTIHYLKINIVVINTVLFLFIRYCENKSFFLWKILQFFLDILLFMKYHPEKELKRLQVVLSLWNIGKRYVLKIRKYKNIRQSLFVSVFLCHVLYLILLLIMYIKKYFICIKYTYLPSYPLSSTC